MGMAELKIDTESPLQTTIKIVKLLATYNPLLQTLNEEILKSLPITTTVNNLVNQAEHIRFVLPAFPAKSPNLNKTLGTLPDLGEVVALSRLHQMCVEINRIYPFGASVVICSDGRVFNDLVQVSDENLVNYKNEITAIIEEFNLFHLTQFSLDDCYENIIFSEMRKDLNANYGPDLESLRYLVKTSDTFKSLFNGMHRFLKEDLCVAYPTASKNFISNAAKDVTYEVMRRSSAWDKLLEKHFKNVVRLSIHPYSPHHHKFTVQLIPGMSHWATPWHNVILKNGENLSLVKKHEALKMGANLKFFKDRYGFFEI